MSIPRSYLPLLANRYQLNGLSFSAYRNAVGVQDWMDLSDQPTLTEWLAVDRYLYRAWKSVLTF